MRNRLFLPIFVSLICLITACSSSKNNESNSSNSSSTVSYKKSTTYVENEEHDNRKIYTIEIEPTELEENEKVPLIIYCHGGGGTATNYESLEKVLVKSKIAGISFEFCGGNNDEPHYSDGDEIYPAHYTSRISDLEAILAYAKTRPYVDTNRIFLWGESYGGITIMEAAGSHNNDIQGLLIISSGYQEDIVKVGSYLGVDEKYLPDDPLARINEYLGDVYLICGDEDPTGAHDNSEFTLNYYNQRKEGNAQMYTVKKGGHGYPTFPKAEQVIVQGLITDFIEEHK